MHLRARMSSGKSGWPCGLHYAKIPNEFSISDHVWSRHKNELTYREVVRCLELQRSRPLEGCSHASAMSRGPGWRARPMSRRPVRSLAAGMMSRSMHFSTSRGTAMSRWFPDWTMSRTATPVTSRTRCITYCFRSEMTLDITELI